MINRLTMVAFIMYLAAKAAEHEANSFVAGLVVYSGGLFAAWVYTKAKERSVKPVLL